MSQKYTGGFITKSPVAPTTTAASGIWTLDQQQQAQKAGTWPSPPLFIEDLFSTYLYTGNGSTQTITNGIDLSTKGGLVWTKCRSFARNNGLTDTATGASKYLSSDQTSAQGSYSGVINAFSSSGYTTGSDTWYNEADQTYVSWTFRKQPKFFDVVTYTGNGSAGGQTINHSLGSAPGCIIVKQTNVAVDWRVYHQTQGISKYAALNSQAAFATDANNPWKTPTSTTFGVGDGTYWTSLNESGGTYVAYLFAHNAGGFGLTGTDNVISCGSYTGNGSSTGPTVSLGYEPQWLMVKRATGGTSNWVILDNMRGVATGGDDAPLFPNLSNAESLGSNLDFNATGFNLTSTSTAFNASASDYIYIAIRRGPMKVPTSGTSVFVTDAAGDNASANQEAFSSTFSVDFHFRKDRNSINDWFSNSRLVPGSSLKLNTTGAEVALAYVDKYDRMSGIATTTAFNYTDWAGWLFKRSPSFFDEVCYTGTGSDTTQTHNLGVAPELVIIKSRSNAIVWVVGNTAIGFSNYLLLNATDASASGSNVFNSTAPTSTVFSIGAGSGTNQSGATYVAYLFATLAGVSKVGSYTGTGALQTINCGFTAGARFVLIKRTDSTGDWWTYDSARGITSGNDPYLYLNSTAAEVTGTNYVDTDTTGFKVTAAAPAGLNANGGTYIFLAIA